MAHLDGIQHYMVIVTFLFIEPHSTPQGHLHRNQNNQTVIFSLKIQFSFIFI